MVLALAAWGAIATVPRFGLIQEQVQLRSAPERVAATLPDDSVLLLPFVAVPSMQEFGMKHWTPSRHPAAERVAIIRELPRADHMLRALDALGLGEESARPDADPDPVALPRVREVAGQHRDGPRTCPVPHAHRSAWERWGGRRQGTHVVTSTSGPVLRGRSSA